MSNDNKFKSVPLSLDQSTIEMVDATVPSLKDIAVEGNSGRSQAARFLIQLGYQSLHNEVIRKAILSGHSAVKILQELSLIKRD